MTDEFQLAVDREIAKAEVAIREEMAAFTVWAFEKFGVIECIGRCNDEGWTERVVAEWEEHKRDASRAIQRTG